MRDGGAKETTPATSIWRRPTPTKISPMKIADFAISMTSPPKPRSEFGFKKPFYNDFKNFSDFVRIGENSAIGILVEILLLILVIFNTVFLSILLHQTKDKLSTATILFIFNILFSNALFVASFVCMFSDFYDEMPYGSVTEDQVHTRLI